MVDSGLDETSCFFADDDGLQVEHGHLFDGLLLEPDGNVSFALGNYSFAYDMSRRKVRWGRMQTRGASSSLLGATCLSLIYASIVVVTVE